jgi:hypothetical protein
MRENINFFLMEKGKVKFDYFSFCNIPKIGDIISVKNENYYLHFEIKFIQYMFDNNFKFEHILITGVLKQ